MKFTFYFYELPSAFGHPARIEAEIKADDGPNGRYDTFFHALATEVHRENIDAIVSGTKAVLLERSGEYWFGGGAWTCHVCNESIAFESEFDETLNGDANNVFALSEFFWVLLAWREFLNLEARNVKIEYEFKLPVDLLPNLSDLPVGIITIADS
jgi:hypothetical protein